MKKLFLCLCLLPLVACVNIKVSSVDPETHTTNFFTGNFLFAKSAAERIEVLKRTKTTSSMLSAKNVSESGDPESMKAFFDGLGNITEKAVAAGVKAGLKQ